MKGKHRIQVQNNRVHYEFEIKRNITILQGDSATGKTTLYSMIAAYDQLGESSGVNVSCDRECRTLPIRGWLGMLSQIRDSIVFLDEESSFIKTEEFASAVKESDNYYVLITRENLPNLPYSVEEIYGIHTSGKYRDTRLIYNSLYRIYNLEQDEEVRPDTIITEDSNAGYEFFRNAVRKGDRCLSAGGKSNIRSVLEKTDGDEKLVIADGAAFGPEMNELWQYIKGHKEVKLYLPESFEWLILSSGLIDGNRVQDILENPEDYIESSRYFSWERFFTSLLVRETAGTFLAYSKARLNRVYLNRRETQAIFNVMEHIEIKA